MYYRLLSFINWEISNNVVAASLKRMMDVIVSGQSKSAPNVRFMLLNATPSLTLLAVLLVVFTQFHFFIALWCLCFNIWNIKKPKRKTNKKTVLCVEEQRVNIYVIICRGKIGEEHRHLIQCLWWESLALLKC